MASIGNSPTQQAFTPAIDYFSGNGSTTAFTLSRPVASVAQVQVTIDNVAQNPSSAFTVSSNTITFTSAPLSGTNNIYVYYTSPITQVIAPGQGTVTNVALDVYGSSGTGAENLPSGTTAQRPSSPVAGANRFNSTLGFAEYWTGSQWATYGTISASSVSYLVVAGGGGSAGGNAIYPDSGGGGGGGLLAGTLGVTPGTSYTVTIGGGGTGVSSGSAYGQGGSGTNSVFSSITSTGGGGGAVRSNTLNNGLSGGSGGGAAIDAGGASSGSGGTATSGQGFAGGTAFAFGPYYSSGGGGGASAVGANGSGSGGGAGGAGTISLITGTSVTYAGGGGGTSRGGTVASGGAGGGGAGGSNGVGTAGTVNTGGGGGGGTAGSNISGVNGGSGVVIISYSLISKLATATGTYTQTNLGGNYIYTFTGSGTITF